MQGRLLAVIIFINTLLWKFWSDFELMRHICHQCITQAYKLPTPVSLKCKIRQYESAARLVGRWWMRWSSSSSASGYPSLVTLLGEVTFETKPSFCGVNRVLRWHLGPLKLAQDQLHTGFNLSCGKMGNNPKALIDGVPNGVKLSAKGTGERGVTLKLTNGINPNLA